MVSAIFIAVSKSPLLTSFLICSTLMLNSYLSILCISNFLPRQSFIVTVHATCPVTFYLLSLQLYGLQRARSVTSSIYSKSPPTGTPLAIRVTGSPVGLISFLKYIAWSSRPPEAELVCDNDLLTSSFCGRGHWLAGRMSPDPIPASGRSLCST